MDENFRREIILDNYSDPMNRGLIEDDSYLNVKREDENISLNSDNSANIYDVSIDQSSGITNRIFKQR